MQSGSYAGCCLEAELCKFSGLCEQCAEQVIERELPEAAVDCLEGEKFRS